MPTPPDPLRRPLRDVQAAAWRDAEPALRGVCGAQPFEVRYAAAGQAAIRQPVGDQVLARHVEPAPPRGAAVVEAACGHARAWLVTAEPVPDADEARAALGHACDRCTALTLQSLHAQREAVAAYLSERSVHRTRADISALEAAWDAVTEHTLTPAELTEFRIAIRETTQAAHARLAQEAMLQRALGHADPLDPVALSEAWEDAVAGLPAGATPRLEAPQDEPVLLHLPVATAAWCLRTLATALGDDPRLWSADPVIAVGPHPAGWELTLGASGTAGEPAEWPGVGLGEVDRVGAAALAGGGGLWVERLPEGTLRLLVVLQAGSD